MCIRNNNIINKIQEVEGGKKVEGHFNALTSSFSIMGGSVHTFYSLSYE